MKIDEEEEKGKMGKWKNVINGFPSLRQQDEYNPFI